uniref:Uncharacterized protein n=1 Tax=Oryza meridionalis TaxID=40149 RepID=A0A0E0D102_9ORYZ
MEGASSAPPPSASPQQFAPASRLPPPAGRLPPPAGRLPPPSMEEAPRTVAGKDWKPAGFPPLPVFSSSRRALLDPSMFSTVLYSTRIKRHNIPQAITVLEDVIGVLIRHMWRAHQEFNFWNLLSEGSVAQRLSFFAFKRGPLHLGGTVYAALRSFTPHNHILNCANGLISSKLSVFKTIQSSLSVFLAEAYRELITYEDKIDGDPVMLMEELSVFLTNSIRKLEISLSNTGDEALLEKAGYDADITIDAIGDKIVVTFAKEMCNMSENLKEASGKKVVFQKNYNVWRRSMYSYFERHHVTIEGIHLSDDSMMSRLHEICIQQLENPIFGISKGRVRQALVIQVNELIAQNRVAVAVFGFLPLLPPAFGLDLSAIQWRYIQRRKSEALAAACKIQNYALYEDIRERILILRELPVSVETEFLRAEEVGLLIYSAAMFHVSAAAQFTGRGGDMMSLEENMRTILRPDSGFEQRLGSAVRLYNLLMGHPSSR